MDNISSLAEKGNYSLVIKLTENSDEPNALYYRFVSFIALNRPFDALDLINKKKDLLIKTHLDKVMSAHIELLCLLDKFEEAYDELNYYQNLPYQSQVVEETLKELPKMIRNYQITSKVGNKKTYDDEVIYKDLMSNDSEVVLAALNSLKELDVNPYLLPISKILTSFPYQNVRSFALMLLYDKKIDHDLAYLSQGKIIKINPSKLFSPFDSQKLNDFRLKGMAKIKDPIISNGALNILNMYLVDIYPSTIDYTCEIYLDAFLCLSFRYFAQKDYGDEKINKLADEIDKVIKQN